MADKVIQGTLKRVEWRSPTGVQILLVDGEDGEAFWAFAQEQRVYVGERVELSGSWNAAPPPGRVLHVSRLVSTPPKSAQGLTDYVSQALACDTTIANAIVSQFGDLTVTVLDDKPERLVDVPGIDRAAVPEFADAWRRSRTHSQSQSVMERMGLNAAQMETIERQFAHNHNALNERLRSDPYLPYMLLHDVPFGRIDAYANENGISPHSDSRMRAFVLFVQRRLCGNGHTYVPEEVLPSRVGRQLGISGDDRFKKRLAEVIEALIDEGYLSRSGNRLYLPHLKQAELDCLVALDALEVGESVYEPVTDWDAVNEILDELDRPPLPEALQEPCQFALSHPVCLIDGGGDRDAPVFAAGLARVLEALSVSVLVTSPNCATIDEQKTAHPDLPAAPLFQALGYDAAGVSRYTPTSPMDVETMIVLDADQLDIFQFRDIARSLPESAGLILIGDPMRQPSMGPGNPYRDLHREARVPAGVLPDQRGADSPAGQIKAAIRGEIDPQSWVDALPAPVTLLGCEAKEVAPMLRSLLGQAMPKLGVETFQVVVPTSRNSNPSVHTLREVVRKVRNPEAGPRPTGRDRPEIDDWLVVRRDMPEYQLSAGDYVRVLKVEGASVTVCRQDETPIVLPGDAAQGCYNGDVVVTFMLRGNRFDAVVLVLTEGMSPVLAHQALLYTVGASARRHLFVIGDTNAATEAVNKPAIETWSGFAELIRENQETREAAAS